MVGRLWRRGVPRVVGNGKCMKFSIIVPCYNLTPWIRQCLDSVLAQSYADWECIVVDDGSSDGSGAILDEYSRRDDRIRVIHQKNAGEGGARNAGLEAAKGEWVFFLDGDDVMLQGALERLAQVAADGIDLIRFGYASFDDGEKPELPISPGEIVEVDVSHEIKRDDFIAYVWQHLYRRNVITGLRFKRYKRGCDRVFLSDVLLNRVKTVLVIDNVCYGYRTRLESAVNSFPSTQVLQDEMDHRLDIMEMIDASPKKVEYKGDDWLEVYFTQKLPVIMLDRQSDFGLIKEAWHERLPRLCAMKGLSLRGRWLLRLSLSRLFRPVGDFLIFTVPYLRYRSPILKPVTRLYRRARRHGEFAKK